MHSPSRLRLSAGILALALIMLASLNPNVHIPEVVTGLIGVGFIVMSLWSSIQANKREQHAPPGETEE